MNEEKDNSDSWAVDKVFGIPELREQILNNVILNKNGELLGKMVGKVRLVEKSWLKTTTQLLRQGKIPVVVLTLNGNDKLEGTEDEKVKKHPLDQLVESFGASGRLEDSFLPIQLNFKVGFFSEENYHNLLNCFTTLGNDLMEIQLAYPFNGGSMPVTFPPFSLPEIRKLSFEFSNQVLELEEADSDDDSSEEGVVDGSNQIGLGLLQSILNASEDLQELDFPYPLGAVVELFPVGFKYIHLPTSISFLEITAALDDEELGLLLMNKLPNLTHLQLLLKREPGIVIQSVGRISEHT